MGPKASHLPCVAPQRRVVVAMRSDPLPTLQLPLVVASEEPDEYLKMEAAIHEFGGAVGVGSLVHATAAANRESIWRWGLDWTRMGIAPGIAGSGEPELPAVFLDHVDGIEFFTRMSRQPCDVWEVDVNGLWIETHDNWLIHRSPIHPARLRLIARDLPARVR
jgi:hypothetical protein